MSITTELGFTLPAQTTGGRVVSPEDVERLVKILTEAEGWLTAREIAARIGPPANERSIRAAANAACPQVISYPGSPGYRLMSACTIEEINHSIAAFQSQGTEMLKRANLINRAYHRRQVGLAKPPATGTVPV